MFCSETFLLPRVAEMTYLASCCEAALAEFFGGDQGKHVGRGGHEEVIGAL